MTKLLTVAAVCAFVTGLTLNAAAAPVPVSPFTGEAFSALNATTQIMPTLSSAYNYSNFAGTITSSVWGLSDGDYLYLYQAQNSGPSVLEILGVPSFYNIAGAGFLTSGEPTGFVSGGLTPLQYPPSSGNYAVTYDETGGANVSFGYNAFLGASVPAGGYTTVLYLISPNAPVVGIVNAMDSGNASTSGYVTSNVPEPSSLMAIGFGAVALLFKRRRG